MSREMMLALMNLTTNGNELLALIDTFVEEDQQS